MGGLNLLSLAGFCVFILLAWMCSCDRRRINVRVLLWGTGLQLVVGTFVFVFPPGRALFLALNHATVGLLSHSRSGAEFVFGALAVPPGEAGSIGFNLAFQGLTTAIFFAALVGLLYHFRVLPFLIRLFSRIFTRLMRVSGAESLCLSSNVFVGIESALTIQPYLGRLTRSELCLVLTAGMATIASTVLGLYVLLLHSVFPNIAGHLVSASLLSAPAALVAAKLLVPEDEVPETLGQCAAPHYVRSPNWISAVANAAMSGFQLAVGIAVLLVASISLLGLLNSTLGWSGAHLGWEGLSVERLASYVFYPLVLLMGVTPAEVPLAAGLMGLRLVATEVPAYQALAGMISDGSLSGRSAVIVAYALCGFAHLPSLGVFIGGIAALDRSVTDRLGRLAFRALFAATLACLMTGAVAGMFYTGGAVVLGSGG